MKINTPLDMVELFKCTDFEFHHNNKNGVIGHNKSNYQLIVEFEELGIDTPFTKHLIKVNGFVLYFDEVKLVNGNSLSFMCGGQMSGIYYFNLGNF